MGKRLEFSRKVKRQIIERAGGPVFMVVCHHCGREFDRGYSICSARAAKPQYCSKECRRAEFRRRSKQRIEETLAATFRSKTERQENGCLHWTGRLDTKGYGRVDIGGVPRLAHRVSYALAYGEDPGDRHVCHSCDNPTCVEPSHLWLGSHADNMADAARKGRFRPFHGRGTQIGTSKLSEKQARLAKFSDEPAPALASRFGVTREAIYAIRRGANWGWLK